MFKKILAAALALVMALGVFGMNAFAADEVLYGDVTDDGTVNSNDALKVLQVATGISSSTAYLDALGDVNADGKVNSADALFILQFATGLKEDFGKSYDKTTKATKVDPIFASGAYTYTLTMTDESTGDFDVVFSTDGKSMVMATTMVMAGIPIEYRLLHKDGKNYQIIPTVKMTVDFVGEVTVFNGVYAETDDDIAAIFKNYEKLFKAEVIYSSTTKKTIGSQKYDCETFVNKNGAVFEYCFYDGELEYLIITNGSTTQTLDISNLRQGAEASKLIIPSDCVYDKSAFES